MSETLEFSLQGSPQIELKNLLKASGLAESGGMAKLAIEEGRVLVDNAPETRKACKIKAGQVVSYDNNTIRVTP